METIIKSLRKFYPIASIDVETSRYYKTDEMSNENLSSLYCNELLGDIVSLAIVSIDKDLCIKKHKYTFKPSKPIDLKASKIHSFNDKFFQDNADLYKNFSKCDAKEINGILKDMN
jgi:DNA polymerase III epsilon subunit-like protein